MSAETRPDLGRLTPRKILESALAASEYIHKVPLVPTPLEPFTLSNSAHTELFDASRQLARLLAREVTLRGTNWPERIDALGAHITDYPLLGDDDVDTQYAMMSYRPDFILTMDGPKVVEFNIGSGLGGVPDTSLWSRFWREAGPSRFVKGPDFSTFMGADPVEVRAEQYADLHTMLGSTSPVLILGTTRDLKGPNTFDYFRMQLDAFRSIGVEAEFVEPEDLQQRLKLLQGSSRRPVLAIRHFTTWEWQRRGIDLSPISNALKHGLVALAPQSAYVIANKKALAWLSSSDSLTGTERGIVDRYLPWTREATFGLVEWRNERWSLQELLLRYKDHFVLKPVIGMSGHQVTLGVSEEESAWAARVEAALRTGSYIVQEKVLPLPHDIWLATAAGQFEQHGVAPIFSPFLFDHKEAGCLVRFLSPRTHDPDGLSGSQPISVHGAGALANVALGTP